jgi:LmbE family N-acetylglucosaminyl deacetylase
MPETIVVVAAHPDDEALGCGGAIARHVAAGETVHVIFMADGVGARGSDAHAAQERDEARRRALTALGVSSSRSLGFPDNRMDSVALLDVVQPLESALRELGPTTLYTHHAGDLNVDHRITHQAVLTACRPLPGTTLRRIFAFEVMSSTEWAGYAAGGFTPNVFIDITAFWPAKECALDAYAAEMRPPPHSRSVANIKALAIHRGHCVGMQMAEAFALVRQLW